MACFCSLAVSLGCSDERAEPSQRYPAPPQRLGLLELSWSIDGEQDPAACAGAGAATFQSLIADGGFIVESIAAPCDTFEVSIPLFRDDFRARSALVSVDGFPVLRRIVEDLFLIEDGRVTRIVIDFPTPGAPVSPDAGAPPGSSEEPGVSPNGTDDAGPFDAGTP